MRSMNELGVKYFPHVKDSRYAGQCLRKKIKQDSALLEELTKASWQSKNTDVTPRQEEIILQFLGTPKEN